MTLNDRMNNILGDLQSPSSEEVRAALLALNVSLKDLQEYLDTAGPKPYYRKLLYQNEQVELLVMNWSELECAPHDHGHSYGWIQVIRGTSENTIYEVNGNQIPEELFSMNESERSVFFAPKKGVHKMKGTSDAGLVTLHLYAPPITGMKVYDLETCAACVVSDDCGAWWPDEQRQKVREIKLKQKND
ncbi:hypothetical protein GLW08_13390 [Pontibacillus yanchengensis]|uniref:Uncharacterized protein n=2 Tax=Pontibacillus yanchengensis TaxID=462910 RepID=A0ACC7VH73_9BACI|nr:cysteine dioxygenase family protein [Pontibacillus yanchengensis]MYL34514.1 hypothetical protein [Pontibacillus yanchengensis]MYL54323.1 hypothetical protein [Pontibacillus yanchengensis]